MDISATNPLTWVFGYLIFYIGRFIFRYFDGNRRHNNLILKAKEYRHQRDKIIEDFMAEHSKFIPTEEKKNIIAKCESIQEIQDCMNEEKFTSVDLLMFYIDRCVRYALPLNILAEPNFIEAFQKAKECDKIRADKEKFKKIISQCDNGGVLFGVPLSFKETFFYVGTRVTLGCINEIDYIHDQESPLEELLKRNHAIMFTKTNVPMLLLSYESNNRIYGRAKNPINPKRSPGGSSGGCGAITSLNASPMSFGADIGGSIRMPANFCGVYGFKGTGARMPCFYSSSGRGSNSKSQEQVYVTCGPLARSMDDIILGNKMMFEYHRRGSKAETDNIGRIDFTAPPMGFNQEYFDEALTQKKLRIGYFTYNGVASCCQASLRAMDKTIKALEKDGHELVEFDTSILIDFHAIYTAILLSAGLNKVALGDEKVVEDYKLVQASESIPGFLKPILSAIYAIMGEYRKSDLVKYVADPSIKNYHLKSFSKLKMIEKIISYVQTQKFDAILTPASSTPAIPHGTFKTLSSVVFNSAIWNYTDFPTCVIPNVHITEPSDTDPNNYKDEGLRVIRNNRPVTLKNTKKDEKFIQVIKETIQNSEGLPVGVQISTLPFEDEKCLALGKRFDEILRRQGVLGKVKMHFEE